MSVIHTRLIFNEKCFRVLLELKIKYRQSNQGLKCRYLFVLYVFSVYIKKNSNVADKSRRE
jgi:hypothetical protein